MSDNIVILSGSPRRNGNTDMLVAGFTRGAKAAGRKVTLFEVSDLKIGGCMGCGHCFEEKGVCIQKDDMPQILDSLRKADALVLASPIYYWSVTAQLKLAIDRMYPLISVRANIKRAAMLLTCGNKNADVNEGALFMLKRLCGAYGWDNAGVVTAAGLHDKGDIEGRIELEEAGTLGRDL